MGVNAKLPSLVAGVQRRACLAPRALEPFAALPVSCDRDVLKPPTALAPIWSGSKLNFLVAEVRSSLTA
jgi:hypothetical protein